MDVTTSQVAAAREDVRRAGVILAKVDELVQAMSRGEDGDYWGYEPDDGDVLKDYRESVDETRWCEEDFKDEVLVEAAKDALLHLRSAAETIVDAATQARRLGDTVRDGYQECSGVGHRLEQANDVLRLMRAVTGIPPS